MIGADAVHRAVCQALNQRHPVFFPPQGRSQLGRISGIQQLLFGKEKIGRSRGAGHRNTLFFGQPHLFHTFFQRHQRKVHRNACFPGEEQSLLQTKQFGKRIDSFIVQKPGEPAFVYRPSALEASFLAGRNKQKPCPLSRPKALQKHIGRRLPLLKIAGHRRHTQCFQPLRIGQGIPPFSAPGQGQCHQRFQGRKSLRILFQHRKSAFSLRQGSLYRLEQHSSVPSCKSGGQSALQAFSVSKARVRQGTAQVGEGQTGQPAMGIENRQPF